MAGGGSSGDYGCGITRAGDGTVSDPYSYTVAAGFINRPVTRVDFWDACRFANWLDNGQPTGAEGLGTTETGTYTLTSTAISDNTVTRNAGATWAVPSEDEWYRQRITIPPPAAIICIQPAATRRQETIWP